MLSLLHIINRLSFLIKPTNSLIYLLSSFFNRSVRSVNCWNSLPHALKEVNSLSTFRSKLLNVDLSPFLIGSAFDISYFKSSHFIVGASYQQYLVYPLMSCDQPCFFANVFHTFIFHHLCAVTDF